MPDSPTIGIVSLLLRFSPYFLFASLTLSVSTVASFIAHYDRRLSLAAGASLDLTLTVTAAWYWLLVRPGLRSKVSLVFVALSGLCRAAFLFPEVVPGKLWIGVGLELAIIVSVAEFTRIARPDGRRPGRAATRFIRASDAIEYYR